MNDDIHHEQYPGAGAFHIDVEGAHAASMTYTRDGDTVTIDHTEVGDVLRGKGAGKRLLEAAVAWARAEHLRVVPRCPFARATFDKYPDLQDVLADQ